MTLHMLAGPVIGAVIGYFTNFLAVKMLFYPRNEIRLWGHRLPLTPGVIPKGKSRLAHAVGNAVSRNLLTQEDVAARLSDPELEDALVAAVSGKMEKQVASLINGLIPPEQQAPIRDRAAELVTGEIMEALDRVDLEGIITVKGGELIREMTAGTMVAMFLSDSLLNSVLPPIAEGFTQYLKERGPDYIRGTVLGKMHSISGATPAELLRQWELEPAAGEELVRNLYRRFIAELVPTILGKLNLSSMIEDKINAMDNRQLEELVLSVMKKELNTIVSLGAVIGFLLGLINMLF